MGLRKTSTGILWEPEGPRALATMAGVTGQGAPAEEPGMKVEGCWDHWLGSLRLGEGAGGGWWLEPHE